MEIRSLVITIFYIGNEILRSCLTMPVSDYIQEEMPEGSCIMTVPDEKRVLSNIVKGQLSKSVP